MPKDHLSQLIDLIEVRNVVGGGFSVGGRWRTRFRPESPLKLVAVVEGSAAVSADGIPREILGGGDVAILNRRADVVIEDALDDGSPQRAFGTRSDEGFVRQDDTGEVVVVGGHLEVNRAGWELMLRALPDSLVIRSGNVAASEIGWLLHRLAVEMSESRPGAQAAIELSAQYLLLEVLRVASADASLVGAGLLRGFGDDRLRPALEQMHDDPGHAWRLDELAQAASMSRSSFAERFTAILGEPPLAHLTRLRMLTARRRLLEVDHRIGQIAASLGYTSESAFSTAFKREVGVSPRRYRDLGVAETPRAFGRSQT